MAQRSKNLRRSGVTPRARKRERRPRREKKRVALVETTNTITITACRLMSIPQNRACQKNK